MLRIEKRRGMRRVTKFTQGVTLMITVKNKRWILFACVALFFSVIISVIVDGSYKTTIQNDDDQKAQDYVNQLWSADNSVRQSAKVNLLNLGHRAVLPLIKLLEDMTRNPTKPRYATSKEAEGEAAKRNIETIPVEQISDYMMRLKNLEINWRLEQDACELLGKLKAEEAIPILIERMQTREEHSAAIRLSDEMLALINIGTVAVPSLIEAIETAELKANSNYRPYTTISLETEEVRTREIKDKTNRTQIRAIRTLGEIGDERALPILERLLEDKDNQSLKIFLEYAIGRISKKSNNKP
jgi:HEAT repeat protein